MCLFDQWGNLNGRERFFQFANTNYRTWQWGTYESGSWKLIPNTSINDEVSAINFQWNIDNIRFWEDPSYGGKNLYYYTTSEKGYYNWVVHSNKASSHSTW